MLRHRVLIADDRAVSADRIKAILPPQFEVVATVRSNDHQVLSHTALRLKPDIILIDIAMVLQDGFQAVKEIIGDLPHTRIVFYTNENGCGLDAAEASAGVASALEACDLVTMRAADCGSSATPSASVPGRHAPSTPSSQELTDREYEVLALLAAGHPMKRIAYRLGITYRTVTFHKYRMMERLGITTNAGLMSYALKRNVSESFEDNEAVVPACSARVRGVGAGGRAHDRIEA